ncbi:hypothetical protein [Egicoccus sp. AB-alg2]|uniref:hypothetical protein n=1 Tax=Egicoccus sp. AB-alg2 TaxID=3242693 RepID=UPI00359E3815
MHVRNRTRSLAGAVVAGVLLTACSTAQADETATETATESATDTDAAGGAVEVVGVDYGFEGLDGPIDAGSTLTFRNASEVEYHEVVVMRVPDEETRSLDELLALPPEEAGQALEFVGVAVAPPGEEGEVVAGDLTLDQPGRYVATCFIPIGADPDVVHEAMHGAEGEDAPPDLGDGEPHAMAGMAAEFTVE